jgi:bifunctional polynucleotide phosphatase/kinase
LVLAATDKDDYRKPNLGMWKYLIQDFNDGIDIVMKDCIYVGDAAGRPAKGFEFSDLFCLDYRS